MDITSLHPTINEGVGQMELFSFTESTVQGEGKNRNSSQKSVVWENLSNIAVLLIHHQLLQKFYLFRQKVSSL